MSPPFPVLILAGERGAGKTSACRAIAALLQAGGRRVGGLLSLSRRDEAGIPQELEIEALSSGERRPLASRKTELLGPRLPRREKGLGENAAAAGQRPFSFSAETLDWALGILDAEAARGLELLILDEIGPLELEFGLGLRPFLDRAALDLASGRELPPLLLAVRPSLAEALGALFPPGKTRILALGLENRATLPDLVLELV